MLTTLLSLYLSASLVNNDLPKPQSLIWQDSGKQITALPEADYSHIKPVINAKSALAIDLETGLSLYEKNIDERLPMASLTKLMTSIVVLENQKLDKVATVSKKASQIEGTKIWLAEGEEMTIKNLLYAAIIHSANDAAYALAENSEKNVETFVEKMNQKKNTLGLYNTHFANPVGLDEKEHFSTARDLAILARYALHNDFIKKAAAIKEMEIQSTNGKLTHKVETTNQLLYSYLKVLGLKTGTTDEAGECLMTIIENDKGHRILTVMLGSPARFKETKILADWVFRTYKWK